MDYYNIVIFKKKLLSASFKYMPKSSKIDNRLEGSIFCFDKISNIVFLIENLDTSYGNLNFISQKLGEHKK